MERLKKLLATYSEEELRALKQHLAQGTVTQLIDARLAELSCAQKVCPVCGTMIDPAKDLTLTFGESLRYRATFDGQDCLAVFVASMGGHAKNGARVTQGLNTRQE